jgi:hypothetical protein
VSFNTKSLIATVILASSLWALRSSIAGGLNPRSSTQNVDGQMLYVERWGDEGPRVVFEAGQGNGISTWSNIAAKVGSFAQAILLRRCSRKTGWKIAAAAGKLPCIIPLS